MLKIKNVNIMIEKIFKEIIDLRRKQALTRSEKFFKLEFKALKLKKKVDQLICDKYRNIIWKNRLQRQRSYKPFNNRNRNKPRNFSTVAFNYFYKTIKKNSFMVEDSKSFFLNEIDKIPSFKVIPKSIFIKDHDEIRRIFFTTEVKQIRLPLSILHMTINPHLKETLIYTRTGYKISEMENFLKRKSDKLKTPFFSPVTVGLESLWELGRLSKNTLTIDRSFSKKSNRLEDIYKKKKKRVFDEQQKKSIEKKYWYVKLQLFERLAVINASRYLTSLNRKISNVAKIRKFSTLSGGKRGDKNQFGKRFTDAEKESYRKSKEEKKPFYNKNKDKNLQKDYKKDKFKDFRKIMEKNEKKKYESKDWSFYNNNRYETLNLQGESKKHYKGKGKGWFFYNKNKEKKQNLQKDLQKDLRKDYKEDKFRDWAFNKKKPELQKGYEDYKDNKYMNLLSMMEKSDKRKKKLGLREDQFLPYSREELIAFEKITRKHYKVKGLFYYNEKKEKKQNLQKDYKKDKFKDFRRIMEKDKKKKYKSKDRLFHYDENKNKRDLFKKSQKGLLGKKTKNKKSILKRKLFKSKLKGSLRFYLQSVYGSRLGFFRKKNLQKKKEKKKKDYRWLEKNGLKPFAKYLEENLGRVKIKKTKKRKLKKTKLKLLPWWKQQESFAFFIKNKSKKPLWVKAKECQKKLWSKKGKRW